MTNYRKKVPLRGVALVVTLLALSTTLLGQHNPLRAFEVLMGRTWQADGKWGDGSRFKQESIFKYDLDSTLVVVRSKGFTNQEQTTYGDRNHGIRKFNTQNNTLQFWEYDVFGGVTTGTVLIEGKNIRYTYEYGNSTVTDLWEYVDANTYNFKVGSYEDGEWKQVYLETSFRAAPIDGFDLKFDHQSLVVTDVTKTGDFYQQVFKFNEIPHPDKAPGFRWFQIRGNAQLHLIEKEKVAFSKDKSIHLCLSIPDLEPFIAHLNNLNIDFYDWPGTKNAITHRSDGVQQIYLQDPEGYWVEINNAAH